MDLDTILSQPWPTMLVVVGGRDLPDNPTNRAIIGRELETHLSLYNLAVEGTGFLISSSQGAGSLALDWASARGWATLEFPTSLETDWKRRNRNLAQLLKSVDGTALVFCPDKCHPATDSLIDFLNRLTILRVRHSFGSLEP